MGKRNPASGRNYVTVHSLQKLVFPSIQIRLISFPVPSLCANIFAAPPPPPPLPLSWLQPTLTKAL